MWRSTPPATSMCPTKAPTASKNTRRPVSRSVPLGGVTRSSAVSPTTPRTTSWPSFSRPAATPTSSAPPWTAPAPRPPPPAAKSSTNTPMASAFSPLSEREGAARANSLNPTTSPSTARVSSTSATPPRTTASSNTRPIDGNALNKKGSGVFPGAFFIVFFNPSHIPFLSRDWRLKKEPCRPAFKREFKLKDPPAPDAFFVIQVGLAEFLLQVFLLLQNDPPMVDRQADQEHAPDPG